MNNNYSCSGVLNLYYMSQSKYYEMSCEKMRVIRFHGTFLGIIMSNSMLNEAVRSVLSGDMLVPSASRTFGVPETTIRQHLPAGFKPKKVVIHIV